MMVLACVCNSLLTSRFMPGLGTFRAANRINRCKTIGRMSAKTDVADATINKTQVTRFVSVDLNDENSRKKEFPKKQELNFEDHIHAFSRKSTWEIVRALSVLRLCAIQVFVNNSLPIMNWTKRKLGSRGLRILFKPMFYKQFVGGENQREVQDCLQKLSETGIRPMLAAAMEEVRHIEGGEVEEEKNESVYDKNCSRILECLEIATAEQTPSPMMQLKMTSLLPEDILVTLGNLYSTSKDKLTLIRTMAQIFSADLSINPFSNVLDEKKFSLLKNGLLRLKKIGEEAKSRGVKVLVDAEYTYHNPGLSFLTLAMAALYNQQAPQIWNTYQCYLKDAYSKLREEMSLTNQLNIAFGAKLVRGAYLTQERARAQKLQIPDPICDNYKATNDNYNTVLQFLLEQRRKEPKCVFIIASHNEESIRLAIRKMEELNVDNQNGDVSFGQLYGMGDQITYPLAVAGYAVYKSIPYGSVEEVLPYLARRATENKSVLEGTRKEQSLLWKEIKHRLRPTSRHRRNR